MAIARSLVANPDLPRFWKEGRRPAAAPLHLLQPLPAQRPKNPMGCYEPKRFPSHEAMVEQLMTIYKAHPMLRVPEPAEIGP